ncbi:MAG: hypothetical protein IJN58_07835 [Clostridia bacterium]|nr:hypothetical protein [Clostridia bacterium]
MKDGLAIWHYPHRSTIENVLFFASQGFTSVSLLGSHMDDLCKRPDLAKLLADIVKEKDLTLTVHSKLPASHGEWDVAAFRASIEGYAAWQREYGLISVLSFDVADAIRDNITPYLQYVLDAVPGCKVAIEDFGLNPAERGQIECFKSEPRFGYLLDMGHMFIRLRGKNDRATLFRHSDEEAPQSDNPGYDHFMAAFRSKEFPIFELHVHNNDGERDMHYFLEEGTLDIPMLARVIRDFGFDGVLTIESAPGFQFPCVYPESDQKILETCRYWKSLF